MINYPFYIHTTQDNDNNELMLEKEESKGEVFDCLDKEKKRQRFHEYCFKIKYVRQ